MNSLHRNEGFTLVEAMVGVALTGLLLAVLVQAQRSATQLSSTSLTLGRVDEAASSSVQLIGRELCWARPNALLITEENGCDRLDYELAENYDGTGTTWSTPITLRFEPSTTDENGNGVQDEGNLVRIQDGRSRVICRNVELGGFNVTRSGDRVEVQLAAFGVTRNNTLLRGSATRSSTLVNGTGL